MNWGEKADGMVAGLRTEVGRDPHDAALAALVGELTTASDDFRARWAAHDVRIGLASPSSTTRSWGR